MKPLPPEMRDWYFQFHWSNTKIWALDVPVTTKRLADLKWHLDLPIWSTVKGKMLFNLRPNDVIQNPGQYPFHDRRIAEADLRYPLEMMFTVDRLAILDGIHRLAKYAMQGIDEVRVRIIPAEYLSAFTIDLDVSLYI